MNNVILKDTFREIKKTKSRFISIAVIIALGTGFFCGLKATAPDLKATADNYYADTNLADFHIQGTLGITSEDIEVIKNIDGVNNAQGGYSVDVFVETETTNAIVRLLSYATDERSSGENYINRLKLVEGRLPNKKNECVMEKSLNTPKQFYVGNTVEFVSGTDDPLEDALKTNYCNIVGVVDSSTYISYERGNSQIGDGQLATFMYLSEENFNYEVYTDLYVTLNDRYDISSFSSEYDELIVKYQDVFETFGKERSKIRDKEIKDEAYELIAEAREELEEGKREADEKLADAENKITDAENELNDGKKTQAKEVASAKKKLADAKQELLDGQKDYDQAYADYLKEIEDAEKEIAEGWSKLKDGEQEILDGWEEYYEGLAKYQAGKSSGKAQISEGYANLNQLKELQTNINGLQSSVNNNDAIYTYVTSSNPTAIASLNGALVGLNYPGTITDATSLSNANDFVNGYVSSVETELSNGADKMDRKLKSAKKQLDEAYLKLVDGENEIAENRQKLIDAEEELAQAKVDAEKEFADALKKLNDGKKEISDAYVTLDKEVKKADEQIADGEEKIADAWKEYNEKKEEAYQKIADAEAELSDAEAKLNDLEEAKWYVFDRTSYPGNGSLGDDADIVDKVAKVFPVFFVLVAGLICFTTMTRMVEEHRTQIGTLKALGYSDSSIMGKYILYAFFASILGSIVGMSIGFKLFPKMIYGAYGTMYHLPEVVAPYDWKMIFYASIVAIACTTVAAYASCISELKSQPSQLMRPKTPKSGKKVLLENIRFIWIKLSFSQKVSIRNISRYKPRVLLTIIGIAGCTALMVAGFGIEHSISNIVDKQFGEIFTYELVGGLADDMNLSDYEDVKQTIENSDVIADYSFVYRSEVEKEHNGKKSSGYIFVLSNVDDLERFITLRERIGHKSLELNDEGVIINEKFAKLLELKVGDTIMICDDGIDGELYISGITENYTENYLYMTPTYYESIYGHKPNDNVFIANMVEFSEENQRKAATELLGDDNIVGISYVSSISEKFKDLMSSLKLIVLVLILCSGALAFVVLYNLTNINVTERIRELATIKVLGFYDNEVSAYIYRENIFSTIVGIGLGLVMGVYLHKFVLQTAELEGVMFDPTRGIKAYVASSILTALFSFIVNFVLHFKLKKIDMVESLKSVE